MPDNYLNLRPGDAGTIRLVDRFGTIHVAWDNGSYCGLVPGMDRWDTIPHHSREARVCAPTAALPLPGRAAKAKSTASSSQLASIPRGQRSIHPLVERLSTAMVG
jgi:Domain of unknown function (DUF4314)